jgi:aspartate 1-decarboxylase
VVFVDSENRVVGTGSDPADALPSSGLLRGDQVYSADDDPLLVW